MEIVRAESGADAVIWLVLAVFWVVAQAISKFKKGGSPKGSPPIITGDRSIEEDLKTFFDQLSGQQQAPPQTPQPPPPPINRPMRPVPYGMDQRRTEPLPPKYKTASKKVGAHEPVRVPPIQTPVFSSEAVESKIIIGHDMRSVAISRGRTGGFKESNFSFKAIRTPLPSMRLPAVHMEGTGGYLRQLVQGPKNLKRAIISRIVLDPPKAFSM